MSVTFFATSETGNTLYPYDFVPQYEEDKIYGKIPTNQNPWVLNVSNSNYFSIMTLLGYEDVDYCGTFISTELKDFEERIQFVLDGINAIPQLDEGTPASQEGNFIDCGRRDGYYQDRLSVLFTIAQEAIKANGMVTFA